MEVYNYRALREELGGARLSFRGTSDTEVMLAAIVEWGLDRALKNWLTACSRSRYGVQERQLHLARDRAGEKPLYYGMLKGRPGLCLGSEGPALTLIFDNWKSIAAL